MKASTLFREMKVAASETPRLYFSAVLDIVRFIERMSGTGSQRPKEAADGMVSVKRSAGRRPSGKSLATSLGHKRKHRANKF